MPRPPRLQFAGAVYQRHGQSMGGPIYFRISPELRRSACYVLVAGPLLAVVFFSLLHFVRGEGVVPAACLSATILVLPSLTMLLPLRWALRLDAQGIARRRLIGWDRWSWEDISSGRIEKKHPHTLVAPDRPWWRRKLSLGYMAPDAISRVTEQINRHYRLPPPPQISDGVEIRYGNFFRRSARFDAMGIHLYGSKEIREYLWSDVRRVHITREDPVRRDFKSLEIVLPDREIELRFLTHEQGDSPNWRGATAEAVNEILERYVPGDRIDKNVAGERPSRRIDVEKQLAKARGRQRDLRRFILVFVPLAAGVLIWMAVTENALQAGFMAVGYAVLLVPLYFALQGLLRSRCLELERHLASFDTATGPDSKYSI